MHRTHHNTGCGASRSSDRKQRKVVSAMDRPRLSLDNTRDQNKWHRPLSNHLPASTKHLHGAKAPGTLVATHRTLHCLRLCGWSENWDTKAAADVQTPPHHAISVSTWVDLAGAHKRTRPTLSGHHDKSRCPSCTHTHTAMD